MTWKWKKRSEVNKILFVPVDLILPTSPAAASNPMDIKISEGLNARSAGKSRWVIACRYCSRPDVDVDDDDVEWFVCDIINNNHEEKYTNKYKIK